MAKITRTTYKFAAITSCFITLILTLFAGILFYLSEGLEYWSLLIFMVVCYLVCFYFIQSRVEKFIYRKVLRIYEDVSLLDVSNLRSQSITTNMDMLSQEVQRFAQNKKMEIEALKIREDYRKEFIGNVSHELKTPLFTVQGYILTLLDGALKDEAILEKYLIRASKGVDRLVYIVKDLEMITKLEVGDLNLHMEQFDMVELIKNVFELLEMKAAKKRISLAFENENQKPVFVEADKERMEQVLLNLIENSIKYGKVDGTSEIGIENFSDNKILVRITDNGEGIEQEYITRLFERFFRVDKSGSRKEGGSGLGLSIVKHLVEAHGEKIYVESQIGIGSEFSFTLEQTKK